MADAAIPDLRGTWKGESETIILGSGNSHHDASSPAKPRLNSVAFTMTIDKQDGRRFSGTFSSARHSKTLIGVITHAGNMLVVDADGYTFGTLLGPDRLEFCYLQIATFGRVASCTEMTRQR